MKRILITGATGTVGRAVVPQLLDWGYEITALVRQPVTIDRCQTLIGSIEHFAPVSGAVAGCDAIVHLACSGSTAQKDVLEQDVAGGAGLIDAWARGPFLYASTSAMYGIQRGLVTERAPILPKNWHTVGKHVTELQLRLAERQNGRGGAVLLRPTLIFTGDGHRPGNVLADIYAQCRQGAHFVFDSDAGLAQYGCSFISGSDFGRSIGEVLARDLSGAFNMAGGFCTWRELIQTVNRVAGAKGDFVIRRDTRAGAGEFRLPQSRTELDTTAFQQATGFQPRETLEQIVEAFVRMTRAQHV